MSVFRFDDVTVDTETREVRRGDEAVAVQGQVFDVLVHLIEHRQRVVAKEELLDAVWEHRFVTESALTSRIKSARKLIGDDGRRQAFIKTVHGRGYRFVGELTETTPGTMPTRTFPGPISDDADEAVRRLPPDVTPFLGRRFELGIVSQLLGDQTTRLLTIHGPGGVGKTRLSIAAAERAASDFEHGVFFVPLAPLTSADQAPDAIAAAMGVVLDARTDAVTQVRALLARRHCLLVLDNVEHLELAEVIADLVNAAPRVTIVVTSRERLGLRAERVFELGGMGWSSDDQGETTGGDAIELFIRAAARVGVDLSVDDSARDGIRRICRLVGGLPLAIELAAGWSDVLSLGEIAAEVEGGVELLETDLVDVAERHRSIRAVCDASWARLTADERDVFMRLSVFRGGFDRAAAGTVAGASLAVLRRLVATSMIATTGTDRFAIHEVLRQYGQRMLEEDDAEEIRRRHSEHYIVRLAGLVPALKGSDQLAAVAAISADIDNVRAAWSCAGTWGVPGIVRDALEALWLYFDVRGSVGSLSAMLDDVERVASSRRGTDDEPSQAIAFELAVRSARGAAMGERGALEAGRELLADAAQQLDGRTAREAPRNWVALTHLWLGWVEFLLARNDEAQHHATVAVDHFESAGDRWGVARCQYLLGNNDTAVGRLERAARTLEQARATADAIGDLRGAALVRRNLAILAGWFGRFDEARSLLDRTIAVCEEAGDRLGLAYALRELGKIDIAEGRPDVAVTTLRRSRDITDELENQWESSATEDDLANAYAALGDLSAAEHSLHRCLDAARLAGNRYYIARATGDLGALAAHRGDTRRASQLLGDARAMWEDIGHEPYRCWCLVELGRLAHEADEDHRRAAQCFADALSIALDHGLAPLALDAAVEAAALSAPSEAATTSARHVLASVEATAVARDRARGIVGAQATERAPRLHEAPLDWRSVADEALSTLSVIKSRPDD